MDETKRDLESERTVTLERDFDVPASVLFRAFSAPEHMRAWFGPPGFPLTSCEMDFRVGGRFRFAMTGPDGQLMPAFGGEYLVIEPNRKIEYTTRFEHTGAQTMIVTLSFEARGRQSRLTQRTIFETHAMKQEHMRRGYDRGVNAGFEQLAALVASWEQP